MMVDHFGSSMDDIMDHISLEELDDIYRVMKKNLATYTVRNIMYVPTIQYPSVRQLSIRNKQPFWQRYS